MKNIFEKPDQKPNGEGDLNEIKREFKLINSKTPEENKESIPPTKEEISAVVDRINAEQVNNLEEVIGKINQAIKEVEGKENPKPPQE